ncbi:MAG TPA: ribokinase [Nitrospiraceae bacterium]|nr:ribokinase [Nitrospiraceae bacterium]
MPKVIVIGSANIDFTVAVDQLPARGETVLGREFYQSYGGKGANQAIAARKAGADVVFLAKIGTDANGRMMEKHLVSSGLPPTGILRDPKTPTGVALIMVDRNGTNQIAVAPGSNQILTAEEVQRASSLMAGARVLLVQLEIPMATVHQALVLGKKHRLTTILNPAPAQPLSTDLLKLVDILTPNEREACRLGGQDVAEEAARILVKRGARCVLVTRGAEGALLLDGEGKPRPFAPFPVDAVDSTGAGDAFNGALACALASGDQLDKAITFANAAGALATTKRGAQEAMPSRREIEQLRRPRIDKQ